jgi:hypothetical protein
MKDQFENFSKQLQFFLDKYSLPDVVGVYLDRVKSLDYKKFRIQDALARMLNLDDKNACTAISLDLDKETLYIAYNTGFTHQNQKKNITTAINFLSDYAQLFGYVIINNADTKKLVSDLAKTAKQNDDTLLQDFIRVINEKKHAQIYNSYLELTPNYQHLFFCQLQDSLKTYHFLQSVKINPEFVDNKKAHAELAIADKKIDYIGISKLCCYLCDIVLTELNIDHRGTHGVLYGGINWTTPDVIVLNKDLLEKVFFKLKEIYKANFGREQPSMEYFVQVIATNIIAKFATKIIELNEQAFGKDKVQDINDKISNKKLNVNPLEPDISDDEEIEETIYIDKDRSKSLWQFKAELRKQGFLQKTYLEKQDQHHKNIKDTQVVGNEVYKYLKSNLHDFLIELHKKELEPITQALKNFLQINCSAEDYQISFFYKEASVFTESPNYKDNPKTFFLEIKINDTNYGDYSIIVHFASNFSGDKQKLLEAIKDYSFNKTSENVYETNGNKRIDTNWIKNKFQLVEEFLVNVSQEYIDKMRVYEGHEVLWGGDIELDILAKVYNLHITIHRDNESEKKSVGDINNPRKIHLYLIGNIHYQYFQDGPLYNSGKIDKSLAKDAGGAGNCLFLAVNAVAELDQPVQDLRKSVCDNLEQLLKDIQDKKEVEREGTAATNYAPIKVQLNDNDNPILSRFKALFEANNIDAYNNAVNDLPNSTILTKAKEIHTELIEILRTIPSDLLQGINEYTDGLTIDSINLNLKSIIKSSENSNLHIESEVVSQQQVSDNLNWLAYQNTSNQYASIVKVENVSGKKHAILLHVIQGNDTLHINLTDPLSEEDSTFKLEITNLAQSLHQEGATIEVVYSGKQDKDYGTCADICLIMLQELIGTSINTSCSHYLEQNHYNNDLLHNFDYDNYHHALLGQDHNNTI